jgi:hypothetical protein
MQPFRSLTITAVAVALSGMLLSASVAHAGWRGPGWGWGWRGPGWGAGCCWRGGVFIGVPPLIFAPPPVYYRPPPYYPPPYYAPPYYPPPYTYGGPRY